MDRLVLAGAVSLSMTALPVVTPAPTAQESFALIVPGERVGPVYADSTSESLRRALGPELVVDTDIGVGEGDFEPGTLIFPDQPTRTLAVLWHDVERRERPSRIIACYHPDPWSNESEPCVWRVTRIGIGLGTRLSELEAINGGPFTLTGFEWDYSGTVVSWAGGRLADILEPRGWRVLMRLAPDVDNDGNWIPRMSYEEVAPVLGDHELRSDHPVIRALDPRTYWIGVEIEPPAAQRHQ